MRATRRLSISHILHRAVLIDVDVQPVGLVVHGAHAVGAENAVFLGEVLLCESLQAPVLISQPLPLPWGSERETEDGRE